MTLYQFLVSSSVGTIVAIIATAIFALMVKPSLTTYFSKKAENLATREDIAKITAEIEYVKRQNAELLQRKLNIYNRQLDILSAIYKPIRDVENNLKGLTGHYLSDMDVLKDYQLSFDAALKMANDEFTKGRLFLPKKLTDSIDTFFEKVFVSEVFHMALKDTVSAEQRAEYDKEARRISHIEIPKLLRKIEKQAQEIIQGIGTDNNNGLI
jgi:hypothetical protein